MGSGYRGAQLNTQLGGGATKHLQGVQEKCVLYSTIKKTTLPIPGYFWGKFFYLGAFCSVLGKFVWNKS